MDYQQFSRYPGYLQISLATLRYHMDIVLSFVDMIAASGISRAL